MSINTEEVRAAYQATDDGLDFKQRFFERGSEFDHWLDEVKAAVWDEAVAAVAESELDAKKITPSNPYRDNL
jgi:hypothetical protein